MLGCNQLLGAEANFSTKIQKAQKNTYDINAYDSNAYDSNAYANPKNLAYSSYGSAAKAGEGRIPENP